MKIFSHCSFYFDALARLLRFRVRQYRTDCAVYFKLTLGEALCTKQLQLYLVRSSMVLEAMLLYKINKAIIFLVEYVLRAS